MDTTNEKIAEVIRLIGMARTNRYNEETDLERMEDWQNRLRDIIKTNESEQKKPETTKANLNIADVSNFLNATDAPTFNDWLKKYFNSAIINETYKGKADGMEHTKDFLYKKYWKAYNSNL